MGYRRTGVTQKPRTQPRRSRPDSVTAGSPPRLGHLVRRGGQRGTPPSPFSVLRTGLSRAAPASGRVGKGGSAFGGGQPLAARPVIIPPPSAVQEAIGGD